MNGFHSKKKTIETNRPQVAKIILKFTPMMYVNKVLEMLEVIRGLSSDEEPGK